MVRISYDVDVYRNSLIHSELLLVSNEVVLKFSWSERVAFLEIFSFLVKDTKVSLLRGGLV